MNVWAAFATARPAKGAKKKYGFSDLDKSKLYFRCLILKSSMRIIEIGDMILLHVQNIQCVIRHRVILGEIVKCFEFFNFE